MVKQWTEIYRNIQYFWCFRCPTLSPITVYSQRCFKNLHLLFFIHFNHNNPEITYTDFLKLRQWLYKLTKSWLSPLPSTLVSTFSSKLTWNEHTDTTTKKASKTINFVTRNFSSCPTHIREQCYKTLVRPQLEYASSVCDNSVKSNINKVESAQHNAARFTCRDSWLPTNI